MEESNGRLDAGGLRDDTEAIGLITLYSLYRDSVYRFLRGRGCSVAETEDLTQEVFLRVLKKKGDLAALENPAGWLKRIALGIWSNWLRDRNAVKRGKREMSLDQHMEERGETALDHPVAGGGSQPEDPNRRAVVRSEIEAVRQDLIALPPKQRQALRLAVVEELSYEQVAKILKVSVNTVKSHVSQGRKKLRELRREREQRGQA